VEGLNAIVRSNPLDFTDLVVKVSRNLNFIHERIPLVFICLSPPACSELLGVGGFPTATAAPTQRAEPVRLHSTLQVSSRCVTIWQTHFDKVRVEYLNLDTFLLLTTTEKSKVPDKERISLVRKTLSPPARSESPGLSYSILSLPQSPCGRWCA
jgi:hypothetical protein